MTTNFTATINNPARAAEWKAILGSTTVPITSDHPTLATLPGHAKAQMIYQLDLDQLTEEQWNRVIEHVATKFEYAIKWIEDLLPEHGIPILAQDVTVTVERPQAMW
jgi:hypothetical protein